MPMKTHPVHARGIAQMRRETEVFDGSCRHRAGVFLQSKLVETIILTLTLVDLFCVLLEIAIDKNWLCFGSLPLSEAAHAADAGHQGDTHHSLRRLSAQSVSAETHHICETADGHTAHHVYHSAHTLSIVILSIFLVELLAKLAVHPKEFCRNCWHVTDLIIVSISFLLDVFMATNHRLTEAVGVLIIVRFWRIARIAHGVLEEFHAQHEQTDEMRDQIRGLIAFCQEKGLKLPEELAEDPEEPWLPFCEEHCCQKAAGEDEGQEFAEDEDSDL